MRSSDNFNGLDATRFLEEQVEATLGVRDDDGNLYLDADTNNNDIQLLRLSELYPFPDHPYKIRKESDYYQNLKNNITERGVRVPITVIKREDGDGYYIVSGHTRVEICRELGLRNIRAIIEDYDMDDATIDMVGTNFYRDDTLTMEKAHAYKMMNDAMKHQGKKLVAPGATCGDQDKNSELCAPGAQSESRWTKDAIAANASDSSRTIMNYIKLCDLIPKLQNEVDKGRMGIKAGAQIANLTEEQQEDVVFALSLLHMLEDKYTGSFFNEDRAKEIRVLAKTEGWGVDAVKDIISPPKAEKEKTAVTVWKPNSKSLASIAREFPSDVPVEEYEQIIKTLIHQHYFSPRKSSQEPEMTLDEQLKSPEWQEWLLSSGPSGMHK